MSRTFSFLFVGLLGLCPAHAATYYVDYTGGSDANAGTSTGAAWQHCPGDPNASGNAAAATLAGGDSVLFKGGVRYAGGISVNWGATGGQVITYKGDAWGTGRAFIDGADLLNATWTQCTNASQAWGNTNYTHLWYAEGINLPFSGSLILSNQFLTVSQDPRPSDWMLWDNHSLFHTTSSITTTNLADATYFTQPTNFWNGAYVAIWRVPDAVDAVPITDYNAATATISFAPLANTPYTSGGNYALLNHPALLAAPGDYAVITNRLYYWPVGNANPNTQAIYQSQRGYGFSGANQGGITVDGFLVQGSGGAGIYLVGAHSGATLLNSNITVINCEVRLNKSMTFAPSIGTVDLNNVVITNCLIHDNFRERGIQANGANHVASYNTIYREGYTGLFWGGVLGGTCTYNRLWDLNGAHANGLTFYLGCSNITVAYNFVSNCLSLVTFQDWQNVSFYNNLIDAAGQDQRVSEWSGTTSGYLRMFNNTLVNNPNHQMLQLQWNDANAMRYLTNNILDANGNATAILAIGGTESGNNNTATLWGYTFFPGANLAAAFVNPATHDWHLLAGALPVNTGVNLSGWGVTDDFAGTARSASGTWDIGAYEIKSNNASAPSTSGSLGAPLHLRILDAHP